MALRLFEMSFLSSEKTTVQC